MTVCCCDGAGDPGELYDLRFDPFQLDGGISEGESPEEDSPR